jgi:hypothetical protein
MTAPANKGQTGRNKPLLAKTRDSLDAKIDALLRGERTDLDALLTRVKIDIEIPSTKTRAHCYVVSLDGNAMDRAQDLAREAMSRLIDYAIPRSEIRKAQESDQRLQTTRHVSQLRAKAKQLFARVENSGEAGEVLLYMLTQTFLQIPQIFCKMPHKTNGQVHVHGIDGIHARVDPSTQHLALYWGESKLHASTSKALNECLDSLKPFFVNTGGSDARSERDLQLLRDHIDLNDPALETAILAYLDRDRNYQNLKFRGICLVGFDHNCYPSTPNSKELKAVIADAETALTTWAKALATQVVARPPLQAIELEAFLLPFPSVSKFREAFRRELSIG